MVCMDEPHTSLLYSFTKSMRQIPRKHVHYIYILEVQFHQTDFFYTYIIFIFIFKKTTIELIIRDREIDIASLSISTLCREMTSFILMFYLFPLGLFYMTDTNLSLKH